MFNEQQLRKNLARNLRYLRFSKSPPISQNKLADHAGTTQKSISRYACGEILPPLYILAGIARYFGCTMDELLQDGLPEKKGRDIKE